MIPVSCAVEIPAQICARFETAAQLALIAEWGCDLYQGFLGAGALNHDELTRFVAAANAELVA